jgi:hypothetical protein
MLKISRSNPTTDLEILKIKSIYQYKDGAGAAGGVGYELCGPDRLWDPPSLQFGGYRGLVPRR